jgi:DNA polymerase III delta prime subunit
MTENEIFMPFGPVIPNTSENDTIFKANWITYGAGKQTNNEFSKSLIDKYKPTSCEDIIGNKLNIRNLKKWIDRKMSSKSSKYNYVLITGELGSGKSEFVRMCFNDLNYSLIEYDQSINKAELEILKESISFTSIEIMLKGCKRKGIVIDNFQDNLSTTQLNDLLKLLKKETKSSPTIFISSKPTKLTDILKGDVLHIDFTPPSSKELLELGKNIVKKECIKISTDALQRFIVSSDYDLRGFLSTLSIFGNKNKIDVNNLDDIQKSTQKDIYLDVQNTIKEFVDPNCKKLGDFNDRCRFVSMNTSCIIQENYLNIVNKKTSIEDLSEMADWITLGDVFKKYMLKNQTWSLSEYSGIFGTEAPSMIIRKNYKVVKKFKIPNRFDSKFEIECCKMNIQDIGFCLSRIMFPLESEAKWIKQMKKSSKLFYDFMKFYNIEKLKALKLLSIGYNFQNKDTNVIKKVKTKFSSEWKLLDK